MVGEKKLGMCERDAAMAMVETELWTWVRDEVLKRVI